MPALGIHDVEVELVAEILKKRNGFRVKGDPLDGQVIGAHDRGIAPGVAAAEPTLLQNRNVADAVILGEMIGGSEPVSAAADDDDVVTRK
jgi:hypothetical protein